MTSRANLRTQVREFLTTRRARITPEQAGLPDYGGRRRVAGLRREEVALLAGISAEYYIRLERGQATGASEAVVDGVARALQLDQAEREHLASLVRAAGGSQQASRRPSRPRVRPTVQRVLDAMVGEPAFVLDTRLDILAANELGRAVYEPLLRRPRPNHARFLFLDPASHDFWADRTRAVRDTVALLRSAAGRDPYDRTLTDLVGELSTRSEEFRTHWAAHDVTLHQRGTKRVQHPVVGLLELPWETLPVAGDAGLTILVYTPEPASPTREALDLLASWTAPPATGDPAAATRTTNL